MEERDDMVVTLDMPGIIAEFLQNLDMQDDETEAYDGARFINRSRGYTLRVTATLAVHRAFLSRCWTFEGGDGIESSSTERSAYRAYAQRIAHAEHDPSK